MQVVQVGRLQAWSFMLGSRVAVAGGDVMGRVISGSRLVGGLMEVTLQQRTWLGAQHAGEICLHGTLAQ